MAPLALRAALVAGALCGWMPAAAHGQTSLVDPRTLGASPSYQHWSFPTPVETDSFAVTAVSQVSLPLALRFRPFRDWQVDVAAAYTRGTVSLDAAGAGGGEPLELDGLTDARVRAVGRLAGERVWLTFGLDLPTGRVRLGDEQAAALRIIGAPAFRMRTPVLGSGAGVLVGGMYTPTLGRWAVGLGASYELRASYSPLEASLAGGGRSVTDLDPAGVVHLSLGLDRIVRQGRFSVLLVGDRYGSDRVTLRGEDGAPAAETRYRLGPTAAAHVQYRTATRAARDLGLAAGYRYRSEFRDAAGRSVAGSGGTMLDAGASATFGRAGGPGVLLALNGVLDSGLEVDPTVATAALSSAALTLGLDLPLGRFALRPWAQGTLARLDPGRQARSARAVAGGITLRAEW